MSSSAKTGARTRAAEACARAGASRGPRAAPAAAEVDAPRRCGEIEFVATQIQSRPTKCPPTKELGSRARRQKKRKSACIYRRNRKGAACSQPDPNALSLPAT